MNANTVDFESVKKDRSKIVIYFLILILFDAFFGASWAIAFIFSKKMSGLVFGIILILSFVVFIVGKIFLTRQMNMKVILPKYSYTLYCELFRTKDRPDFYNFSPTFYFYFYLLMPFFMFSFFLFLGALFRINSFLAGNKSAIDIKWLVEAKRQKAQFLLFDKSLLNPNEKENPQITYANFVTLEQNRNITIDKKLIRRWRVYSFTLDILNICVVGSIVTLIVLIAITLGKKENIEFRMFSIAGSFTLIMANIFPIRIGVHRKLLKYSPWAQKILLNKRVQNFKRKPSGYFYLILAIPFVYFVLSLNAVHTIKKYERGKTNEFPNLINATYQAMPEVPENFKDKYPL